MATPQISEPRARMAATVSGPAAPWAIAWPAKAKTAAAATPAMRVRSPVMFIVSR
jgi:hypothetical protein